LRTFVGRDLVKWNTASVTTLKFAFAGASAMNVDMSKWNVAKVTTMHDTFSTTLAFEGTGLAMWDTTSVTTLEQTFAGAAKMNVDISGWNVAKVTSMAYTFHSAVKFTGTGLATKWNTDKVGSFTGTFLSASSLTSCTKRTIADAWASSTVFAATNYPADWAGENCDPKVRGVRQR
jgi:surface protein